MKKIVLKLLEMILIIGDPHITKNNVREVDILIQDIETILESEEVDFVVILGDTLHYHNITYTHDTIMACKLFKCISKRKPLYILVGNHERMNNKDFMSERHSLLPYAEWHNITVIDKCQVVEWKGKKICMAPYVPDGRFMEALEVCGIDIFEMDLVFSHSEFKGCEMNKKTGKHCDAWKKNFPLNIAGHIHKHEIVGHNLIYVGTAYHQTFGEGPEDKGLFLLDESFELRMITLNIPKKVDMTIDYTDIDSFEVEPLCQLKLKIRGPREVVEELLETPENQIKFKDVVVEIKDTLKSKRYTPQFKANMSFIDRLQDALSKDEVMRGVYDSVFQRD